MRVFLLSSLVAILLATGAAFILNSAYVPSSASEAFSTQGARI